jgi:hypothetical protein
MYKVFRLPWSTVLAFGPDVWKTALGDVRLFFWSFWRTPEWIFTKFYIQELNSLNFSTYSSFGQNRRTVTDYLHEDLHAWGVPRIPSLYCDGYIGCHDDVGFDQCFPTGGTRTLGVRGRLRRVTLGDIKNLTFYLHHILTCFLCL